MPPGKPFFLQLMTTSNHRPYTYPEGRIDIPSGDGREGAVKYTDYAIGQFLAAGPGQALVQTDRVHLSSPITPRAAPGMEDLPVANYHIPLFIYAPAHDCEPREFGELASQIDLGAHPAGPAEYRLRARPSSAATCCAMTARQGRALLGNYQHLGLFDGSSLAILSPRKSMRRHDDALGLSHEVTVDVSDALEQRNIAYYQGASHAFREHLIAWRPNAQPVEQLSKR